MRNGTNTGKFIPPSGAIVVISMTLWLLGLWSYFAGRMGVIWDLLGRKPIELGVQNLMDSSSLNLKDKDAERNGNGEGRAHKIQRGGVSIAS